MFDVITIGGATRDVFVKSKSFKVSGTKRGEKILAMPLGAKLEISEMIFMTGGGATNSAVTFRRQGFKTAILTYVGDDFAGKAVEHELASEKINTEYIKKMKGGLTGYSLLLHAEGGERTILVHRGASECFSEKDLKLLRTRWFYVSSLAGDIKFLKKIIETAKKIDAHVAYNPGGRELAQKKKLLPLLGDIDILIMNREEASFITGVPVSREGEIFKKWDAMAPGINVMTDGRHGVWVSDGFHLYTAGIYKEKKIIDRTGAGDAFGSGFVSGIMSHLPGLCLPLRDSSAIEYAMRLGSANATAKVEGVGAKFGLLTRKKFETESRFRKLVIKKTTL